MPLTAIQRIRRREIVREIVGGFLSNEELVRRHAEEAKQKGVTSQDVTNVRVWEVAEAIVLSEPPA